ncbi:hypothetical protein ACFFWC_11925 [Plantactinospora siamensis]|uniref:Uncharacterized protein n=1 Tax=Plantactinospora siamensis TaxID=555372 RepID=A0ABV6P1G1_9ACTN
MTAPGVGRIGCAYLILWLLLFASAIFAGDGVMLWLTDVLSGVPVPLVTVLGWLPFGLLILCLLADAMDLTAPSMRQPWLGLVAVLGLLVAVEVPTVFRQHPGEAYEAAAGTPAGQALILGAASALFSVLLFTLGFLTVRWLRARLRGEPIPFRDGSWGAQPESRRRFGVGASVTAVLGLVISLVVG